MKSNLSDINNLLDELYVELLNLVEQHTSCRANIERTSNAGQLLLAKTRYNQGFQMISMAQIPTENSDEFNALCKVGCRKDENTVSGSKMNIIRYKVDKKEKYVEPMHWFTVLPPNPLRNAAEQYKKTLDYVVESANIQTEMLAVMQSINHLKALKQQC